MMMMYLICENCRQVIGAFNTADIKLPLGAHMFKSHLPPERQVPGPFTPGADWMHFKCTQCPRRPIFEHDRLYCSHHQDGRDPIYVQVVSSLEAFPAAPTVLEGDGTQPWPEACATDFATQPDGLFDSASSGDPTQHAPQTNDKYACPDCGKEYQNQTRYEMYHKKCKARAS